MNSVSMEQLQIILGYRFSDEKLLQQALTHPSYSNENDESPDNYQRLEFLGDAVLGMLLADMLFRRFPREREGGLSRYRAQLADQQTLSEIARSRGIGGHILMGRGEELSSGRHKDSILCDILEALIAAVYLDGGLEPAREFVAGLYAGLLDLPAGMVIHSDAKSQLQELLCSRNESGPVYELISETGPPHDRLFCYNVLSGGNLLGRGEGGTKKAAQQEAAVSALKQLLGLEAAAG